MLNFLRPIKEVSMIDTFGNKYYKTVNYVIYMIIDYIINILKCLRNMYDIETDNVQIITYNKSLILRKNNMFNFKYIKNMINDQDNNMRTFNKRIYSDVQLLGPIRQLSFKPYMEKYSDPNKIYDNTIENILLFNNININDHNSMELSYRKEGKPTTLKIPYCEIKNKHIGDIYDL